MPFNIKFRFIFLTSIPRFQHGLSGQNNLSFSFTPNINPISPIIGQKDIDVSPVGPMFV